MRNTKKKKLSDPDMLPFSFLYTPAFYRRSWGKQVSSLFPFPFPFIMQDFKGKKEKKERVHTQEDPSFCLHSLFKKGSFAKLNFEKRDFRRTHTHTLCSRVKNPEYEARKGRLIKSVSFPFHNKSRKHGGGAKPGEKLFSLAACFFPIAAVMFIRECHPNATFIRLPSDLNAFTLPLQVIYSKKKRDCGRN